MLAARFSAKAIREYRPQKAEIVTWVVDQVIESGRIDFVDDLSNPLPALVSLDYFGLPLDRWELYATALHKAAYREKGPARAVDELLDDLRSIVERRRATAGERGDIVDRLLTAEVEGERLDEATVTGILFMLLNGGNRHRHRADREHVPLPRRAPLAAGPAGRGPRPHPQRGRRDAALLHAGHRCGAHGTGTPPSSAGCSSSPATASCSRSGPPTTNGGALPVLEVGHIISGPFCLPVAVSAGVPRVRRTADVVVENFRPGTMERWGLCPDRSAPTGCAGRRRRSAL